jgi:hypothetical protein
MHERSCVTVSAKDVFEVFPTGLRAVRVQRETVFWGGWLVTEKLTYGLLAKAIHWFSPLLFPTAR